MIAYDPEIDPVSKEEWDAYIQWCADELLLFIHNDHTPRSFRTAFTCAAKLLVVAGSQLHLEPSTPEFEVRSRNLAALVTTGRAFERARPEAIAQRAILARSVLDCWAPVGKSAPDLLEAAKDATSALIIVMSHPLENPWDLDAPDVWSLVLLGFAAIERIPAPPDPVDYTVTVNTTVTDRMHLQKANGIVRSMGGNDLSSN
jgi:hypothetical protein